MERDRQAFSTLCSRLREECADVFVATENLHVPDQVSASRVSTAWLSSLLKQVFCMLRAYDRYYEKQVEVGRLLGCYSSPTPAGGFSERYSQKLHSKQLSISRCMQECDTLGFTHFAITMRYNCFCGNDNPLQSNRLDDLDCSADCNGYSCGSQDHFKRFSVYAIVQHGSRCRLAAFLICSQRTAI